MHRELVNRITRAALAKVALLKNDYLSYYISAILAGVYVGFGVILILTVGTHFKGLPSQKLIMGLIFGVALSLVVMAGSELFTGNNLTMVVGLAEKKVNINECLKVWFASFFGNLIGSFLLAFCYIFTGLLNPDISLFTYKLCIAKSSMSIVELITRGILCNMLVCLGVLTYFKLEEETSKLIMIFWCLLAFITSGYEHSIANMTIFSIGILSKYNLSFTITKALYNLAYVTIGNFIGGGLIIGWSYWYKGRGPNVE